MHDLFAHDVDRMSEPWGWDGPAPEPVDRLTHLVLVDGRLVETWTGPVEGTRWQRHADRFDRELQRPEPVPPPWQQVLDWLADLCGGPAAVAALGAEPLDDAVDLPADTPDARSRGRLEATAELLDAVAERWFDDETAVALRRALLRVWDDDPDTVLLARSAAHLAGGLCWAVGKANGCFRPQGELTMARVQESLALRSAISGYGTTVERALRGFRPVPTVRWRRPLGVPDLLPLGVPGLLTSTTRERLVRLRDRALAARAEATPAA